jgi:bloom syndrome protein
MASTSGPDVQRAIAFSLEKLGYESLKPEQERVVREFLSGKDVFAALPTGYGKSLCYACLPHAFDSIRGKEGSIVVCVSPLTSLMLDQRAKFVPRGLLAEFVGEAQSDPQAIESVRDGKVQLLFISPESLLSNPQWRDMLSTATYRDNLAAFVVDEAHCVKKW